VISQRLRLIAAGDRVPSPRLHFSRYVRHETWHVCAYMQYLPFDSDAWIEVTWWTRSRGGA